jgi:hypothetical protein
MNLYACIYYVVYNGKIAKNTVVKTDCQTIYYKNIDMNSTFGSMQKT